MNLCMNSPHPVDNLWISPLAHEYTRVDLGKHCPQVWMTTRTKITGVLHQRVASDDPNPAKDRL